MQHIEILMECKKKTLMQFSSSVCKNQCGRNSFSYTAVHLLQSYANVQKKKKNHTLVLTHERSWGHNLLLNLDWSTLKYIQILRRCKTCVQLHFLPLLLAVFLSTATWARLLYVTLAQNANTELHLLLPLGASLCYGLDSETLVTVACLLSVLCDGSLFGQH